MAASIAATVVAISSDSKNCHSDCGRKLVEFQLKSDRITIEIQLINVVARENPAAVTVHPTYSAQLRKYPAQRMRIARSISTDLCPRSFSASSTSVAIPPATVSGHIAAGCQPASAENSLASVAGLRGWRVKIRSQYGRKSIGVRSESVSDELKSASLSAPTPYDLSTHSVIDLPSTMVNSSERQRRQRGVGWCRAQTPISCRAT